MIRNPLRVQCSLYYQNILRVSNEYFIEIIILVLTDIADKYTVSRIRDATSVTFIITSETYETKSPLIRILKVKVGVADRIRSTC